MEQFDYSPEQWRAIAEAVRKVRETDLTESERSQLRGAASRYKFNCQTQDWWKNRTRASVAAWLQAAKLSEELSVTLTSLQEIHRHLPQRLRALPKSLLWLQQYSEAYTRNQSDDETPRQAFYRAVLMLWTDHFHGKLSYSADRITQKASGPLPQYFCAVVNPVLDKGIVPESVKKIVKAEKERRNR